MKKKDLPKIPYSKKVFVAPSKIHGLGVFSRREIRKGDTVFIIKGRIVHWKVKDEKTALQGEHWIGMGKDLWIDPIYFGRYLNHSSSPSCGIKGKVTVCALRSIKPREEITVDYSTTEDQVLWWMEDHSNKKGKRVVRSIQYLPVQKFKSYLPFIPRYFRRVYVRHHDNVKVR